MERLTPILRDLLSRDEPVVLVSVGEARGSTPREVGASMLVTRDAVAGSIGGGRLEWIAMERAREMIAAGDQRSTLDLALGPSVGQCCGGRVRIDLARADEAAARDLAHVEDRQRDDFPQVMIFGAGHVGRALAKALAPLPLAVTVIDSRAEALADLPAEVRALPTADPVAEALTAPTNAAFVVMTHSHQLDHDIVEAALAREDARYVGLIGSDTKRKRFERWFLARGGSRDMLDTLVCPIGGVTVRDKRPPVIAALGAAELITRMLGETQTVKRAGPVSGEKSLLGETQWNKAIRA